MLSSRFYCRRQGGRKEMALERAGPAAYDWSLGSVVWWWP